MEISFELEGITGILTIASAMGAIFLIGYFVGKRQNGKQSN